MKLCEICNINMGQSPDSSLYNEEQIGMPFYQGNADFGEIHPKARMWCTKPTKIAKSGDILISVRAPIGALNIANEDCCIGRGLAAITADSKKCSKKYLWYALESKKDELISKGTGSTFKAISKNVLFDTEIPYVPLDKQIFIEQTLDKISQLVNSRKKQLDLLSNLVASRFIEMFGDPVANSKNWNISSLLSIGYCKNGMNFHTGDNGVDIRCLGVADFKNLSVIDGTENLPIVSLNELPSKDSMLKDGDIVFVRSNGNKALVGRCLLVYPHNIPTTYSGFCIRFRLTSKQVMPEYLLRVLKSDSISKKMMGRGANIQNLNQQILASLDIPIPPLDLQNQFAEFVKQTDKSKLAVQKSLEQLETLKKSLMQKYFG